MSDNQPGELPIRGRSREELDRDRSTADSLLAFVPIEVCERVVRETLEEEARKLADHVLVDPEAAADARAEAEKPNASPLAKAFAEALSPIAGKKIRDLDLAPDPAEVREFVGMVRRMVVQGWIQTMHEALQDLPPGSRVCLDAQLLPTTSFVHDDSLTSGGITSWLELFGCNLIREVEERHIGELLDVFAPLFKAWVVVSPEGVALPLGMKIKQDVKDFEYYVASAA